jgi:Single-strand binding protein family
MNNVNLVGRLTRDPELKEIGGGRSVCELRVAVDNPGRGGERGKPTYVDASKRSAHSVRGSVEFLGPKADSEGAGSWEREEMAPAL